MVIIEPVETEYQEDCIKEINYQEWKLNQYIMYQVLCSLFKLERSIDELFQREEYCNQDDVDVIGINSQQPFYGVHNRGLEAEGY